MIENRYHASALTSFAICTLKGNAMEGQCEVALLDPGIYNETTSPAFTSAGQELIVGDDNNNTCPDILSGSADLFNYELSTVNFKCLDSSAPKDGYLE